MTREVHPDARAYQLASEYAEEYIRKHGTPAGTPDDRFIFRGTEVDSKTFQFCVDHLKWIGRCVAFENADETVTVIFGDYSLG